MMTRRRANFTGAVGVLCALAAMPAGCGSGDDETGASTGSGGSTGGAAGADAASGGSAGEAGTGGAAGAGGTAETGGSGGLDGSTTDGPAADAGGGGNDDGGETDAAQGDVANDNQVADDGNTPDGGTTDGAAGSDSGGSDSAADAAADGAGPVPLPACSASAQVDGPIATAVNPSLYGTYDNGPLMLQDERAFVFLEGSDMWMTASQGSATTGFVPSEITGASRLSAWLGVSGWNGVTFQKSSKVWATTFKGVGFSTPLETPCTSGGYGCEAHVAGDGHMWIRFSGNFYEQVGNAFENRGGGPVAPSMWDVDAQGTVIVFGAGDSSAGEVLAEWKLPAGAGGWSKVGTLKDSDIASVAPSIEGGFQFGSNGLGTLAPDGSIHLFSDAHCVNNGDHNKAQAYLRSHDGVSWDVQLLPSADDLTDGLVTWRDVAFWASDYENVRYVVMSSPAPTFDGYTWYYPDRRYDVISRCDAGGGQRSFARIARVMHPGWTVRGFAGFSDWGTATLLTQSGLSQVR